MSRKRFSAEQIISKLRQAEDLQSKGQSIVENFLFGEEDQLELETDFFDKGIIDSTGVIELVSFLEETFEISINDEELIPENLSSLINIREFLQQKTDQKVA